MTLRNLFFALICVCAVASSLLAVSSLPALAQTIAVGDRNIIIALERIKIRDEDDPFSNDEPYLIVTKFRMRVQFDPSGVLNVVSPAILGRVMTGRYSIRHGADWAAEPNSYSLPRGTVINEWVPGAEDGWVVGAIIVHMENDGFDTRLAAELSRRVFEAVQGALTSPTLEVPDTSGIAESLHFSVLRKIRTGILSLNFGGMVRGLAGAVDPDDFGGVGAVLVVTVPGGGAMVFDGPLAGNPASAVTGARPLTGSAEFSIHFPTKNARSAPAPDNVKFKGSHLVQGRVTLITFSGLD